MGWEDRPYYRDRSGYSANPILRALSGSVPLYTAFGIRVRAHVGLIILTISILLMDRYTNYPFALRAVSMVLLWISILLHEYGHCFGARWVGGSAHEILLWPLGGLAMADTPHRAMPRFLMVLAGPMVSLLICLFSAAAVYGLTPTAAMHAADPHAGHVLMSLNPFRFFGFPWNPRDPLVYLSWLFSLNLAMLLLNLLPIFPLDGGQMFQCALWGQIGYFRSMVVATTVGMTGSVIACILAVGTFQWFLAVLFLCTFVTCYQRKLELRETGPEDWQDQIDYSASIYQRSDNPPRQRRRLSRRVIKKARRIAQREKAERDRIDVILAKVSAQGMQSLTWIERRVLRKTTERHRRRELELSRFQ